MKTMTTRTRRRVGSRPFFLFFSQYYIRYMDIWINQFAWTSWECETPIICYLLIIILLKGPMVFMIIPLTRSKSVLRYTWLLILQCSRSRYYLEDLRNLCEFAFIIFDQHNRAILQMNNSIILDITRSTASYMLFLCDHIRSNNYQINQQWDL